MGLRYPDKQNLIQMGAFPSWMVCKISKFQRLYNAKSHLCDHVFGVYVIVSQSINIVPWRNKSRKTFFAKRHIWKELRSLSFSSRELFCGLRRRKTLVAFLIGVKVISSALRGVQLTISRRRHAPDLWPCFDNMAVKAGVCLCWHGNKVKSLRLLPHPYSHYAHWYNLCWSVQNRPVSRQHV